MTLPINIETLLSNNVIESERIEFKEGWNPDSIYHTICAFANDFDNTGGGYIVIGIKEENGMAKRPVSGLEFSEIEKIQKAMIGFNNLLRPAYFPKLSIELVDDKNIIVLWVPAGPNRPYEVPEKVTLGNVKFNFYIRRYSSTIVAKILERTELFNLANNVPFDDRVNTNVSIEEISGTLLLDHLKFTNSRLYELAERRNLKDLLANMDLIAGPVESLFPKNAALLLFSEKPDKFFHYCWTEIVEFPKGPEDPEFIERPNVTGPIQNQIIKVVEFFKTNILKLKIIKQPDVAESKKVWNYPMEALEEAIANAIYHKDYQVREPIEIRVYPNSITILNYGGPDRSITKEAFVRGVIKPRRYRNRKIGDFLKELNLTEGKATGIPRIKKALKDNGSPDVDISFDDERTFFQIEFGIHPLFYSDETQTVSTSQLDEAEAKIIDLLLATPNATMALIAKELEVSSKTIQNKIKKLKAAGIVKRIGSKKTGNWIINV